MKILYQHLFHLAVLLLILPAACSKTDDKIVFPAQDWEHRSPESQGMDAVKLQSALKYLEPNSLHNGNKELLIVRNGYVIFAGPNVDSVHNIWSCSKTFTSTVLGLLLDDHVVTLDDCAADYEPLLKEKYSTVTFRHFATMTSGYSAVGDSRWESVNYADWSWTVYEPDDPYFAPGTAFAYWDEAQMMFGRVLTQVLKRPMHDYLKEKITDTIGMGDWEWYPEKDLKGIPINNGCTNVHVNAKQLARWGWLFLNKGNWKGRKLISKKWVEMAASVQVPTTIPVADTDRKDIVGPGCYGFNWWINGIKADGRYKLPGAPPGCYFASGFNNNKCVVIPDWNVVIVRMGEDGHPRNPDLVYGTFLRMIGEAIIK
ncbi:serine hydrolase [candidate division KSB1 bacterium]|nr:serine hydrolase [candidate division KSB1 bacterium]